MLSAGCWVLPRAPLSTQHSAPRRSALRSSVPDVAKHGSAVPEQGAFNARTTSEPRARSIPPRDPVPRSHQHRSREHETRRFGRAAADQIQTRGIAKRVAAPGENLAVMTFAAVGRWAWPGGVVTPLHEQRSRPRRSSGESSGRCRRTAIRRIHRRARVVTKRRRCRGAGRGAVLSPPAPGLSTQTCRRLAAPSLGRFAAYWVHNVAAA